MEFLTNLLLKTALQVWITFTHNWPFLLVSVLIAVALKLFVDANKVSAFLIKYRKAGVIGATAAAVATPLCSCGTTAIILGMMAGMMPWAPIVAFMVASPLTSPEGLVYSAGLFGWPFAIAFYIASIVLGLLGGLAAGIAESRGWLANQARLGVAHVSPGGSQQAARASFLSLEPMPLAANADAFATCCGSVPVEQPAAIHAAAAPVTCGCGAAATPPAGPQNIPIPDTGGECGCESAAPTPGEDTGTCGCSSSAAAPAGPSVQSTCGCGTAAPVASSCVCSSAAGKPLAAPAKSPVTLRLFATESFTAARRLLVMFFGFAFIGYFLNGLIPQAWVSAIFGSGNIYSVPLAATLGLPLYINSEASLPLVRALIDGGMSQGAALAFLITGAGTSIGALAGALTIARWRVIALVIGTLWIGATVIGTLYNLLLVSGLL